MAKEKRFLQNRIKGDIPSPKYRTNLNNNKSVGAYNTYQLLSKDACMNVLNEASLMQIKWFLDIKFIPESL